jgi:hypothetical protein
MSLTVACVWVNGHLPYPVEYVEKLHAMARRYISRPFEFVCLTDQPTNLAFAHIKMHGVNTVTVPKPAVGVKGWWSKVELFNSAHGLKGRVLYLDLDTLIVDSLDAVIDYPADFALAPHGGTFNGKGRLQVVKRFNSSVMVWDAGAADFLYRHWTPAAMQVLWGDQDWTGMMAPGAATMPAEWFPRMSEFAWPNVPKDAKVVLCKKPKNADASKVLTGFAEAWG